MTALLIFLGAYLVLVLGRLPFLRIDRTGAAIIGASLLVGFDVLTLNEAYQAIDYDTLILLFGMMIVVANLRLSGFFRLVSARVMGQAHRPAMLLVATVFVSGVLSAFFVNDTMCIVMTPLVLEVAAGLQMNPVPYLLAVAMGSNVGSVATITGNPQNMMVGNLSGIPYREFSRALAPVALGGLILTVLFLLAAYRKEFRVAPALLIARPTARIHRGLMWKSLAVAAGMIVMFFAGWPVPKVAVVAGALLLITRRIKPDRVYREIDWGLLVLFSGLFVVVAGVEKPRSMKTCSRWLPDSASKIPQCFPPPRRFSRTSSAMSPRSWSFAPSSRICPTPSKAGLCW